jgi:fatty acid desaturase
MSMLVVQGEWVNQLVGMLLLWFLVGQANIGSFVFLWFLFAYHHVSAGIVDDNGDAMVVGNDREMPFGANPTCQDASAFVTFAIAEQ